MFKSFCHIIAVMSVALSVVALGACSRHDENNDALIQEIKAADKMIFASMSVTKTARLEDSEWYKVGKRIAVYSYDTYLQAYIDMSQLQPDDVSFDDKSHTARIILPPVKIEIAGRDMDMKKVYENVGIFRSDIDAKERAIIKEQANESLKKELKEDGSFNQQLTSAAKSKARQYFKSLMEANGYDVIIEFRDEIPSDYNSTILDKR